MGPCTAYLVRHGDGGGGGGGDDGGDGDGGVAFSIKSQGFLQELGRF